jgi:hypothetical protein
MRQQRSRLFWVSTVIAAGLLTVPAIPFSYGPGRVLAKALAPACAAPMPPATWSTKAVSSTGTDYGTAVAVDTALCAIYVAGETSGTVGAASAGPYDGFVARYGSSGTQRWVVQFGSADNENVDAIATDADHFVYVAGSTTGALPGSPVINFGGSDAFLVKYDENGALVWTRQLGSVGDEYAHGIAIDQNGDIFVVGRTTGVLIGASAGDEDYFLARYDRDGNLVMLVQDGTSGEDRGIAVAIGPSGNAYVLGQTDGVLGAAAFGDTDLFVAKYDPAGGLTWIEQRGSNGLDLAGGIAVNADGQVFVSASVEGSLDGGVDQPYLDVVVIRYDANGTWRWTDQRGTADTDTANGIALSPDGTPYTTGSTGGALDGNVSAGGTDLFVMAHGRGGTWRWTSQLGGSANDYAHAIAVGASRNLFVVGNGWGAIGTVPSPVSYDAFAVSFSSGGALR